MKLLSRSVCFLCSCFRVLTGCYGNVTLRRFEVFFVCLLRGYHVVAKVFCMFSMRLLQSSDRLLLWHCYPQEVCFFVF